MLACLMAEQGRNRVSEGRCARICCVLNIRAWQGSWPAARSAQPSLLLDL